MVGGKPEVTEVDHPEKPGEKLQLIVRPANVAGSNDYLGVTHYLDTGRFVARSGDHRSGSCY